MLMIEAMAKSFNQTYQLVNKVILNWMVNQVFSRPATSATTWTVDDTEVLIETYVYLVQKLSNILKDNVD